MINRFARVLCLKQRSYKCSEPPPLITLLSSETVVLFKLIDHFNMDLEMRELNRSPLLFAAIFSPPDCDSTINSKIKKERKLSPFYSNSIILQFLQSIQVYEQVVKCMTFRCRTMKRF